MLSHPAPLELKRVILLMLAQLLFYLGFSEQGVDLRLWERGWGKVAFEDWTRNSTNALDGYLTAVLILLLESAVIDALIHLAVMNGSELSLPATCMLSTIMDLAGTCPHELCEKYGILSMDTLFQAALARASNFTDKSLSVQLRTMRAQTVMQRLSMMTGSGGRASDSFVWPCMSGSRGAKTRHMRVPFTKWEPSFKLFPT